MRYRRKGMRGDESSIARGSSRIKNNRAGLVGETIQDVMTKIWNAIIISTGHHLSFQLYNLDKAITKRSALYVHSLC
jgi:hypothetical protein